MNRSLPRDTTLNNNNKKKHMVTTNNIGKHTIIVSSPQCAIYIFNLGNIQYHSIHEN